MIQILPDGLIIILHKETFWIMREIPLILL